MNRSRLLTQASTRAAFGECQSTQCDLTKAVRAAFVTNICPHYRVNTFETLSQKISVEFLFYSSGKERYWQGSHGLRVGNFPHAYLPGFHLSRGTRIVPSLPLRLWKGRYNVIIKCINGRFALPVTYVTARVTRRPFILWTGVWMSLRTPFHRLVFPFTRWIYRHADAIVVYGEHVKRYLMSLNVSSEKIFVAAHAVDNSQYNRPVSEGAKAALRERLGLENHKIVLYLGRLEEEKGVEYLLQAFALLKSDNAALVIVGDGSMRQQLMALVGKLDLGDRTRFVGYVAPEEAAIYYAVAECFVLPSVTMPTGKEPWGLVVNEALNQALPVIASEAVGAAAGGLVQAGINGLIVPERDSEALARAIGRVIGDSSMRARLSQNALRIVSGWDNDRMVEGFERAIDYALNRTPACDQKQSIS